MQLAFLLHFLQLTFQYLEFIQRNALRFQGGILLVKLSVFLLEPLALLVKVLDLLLQSGYYFFLVCQRVLSFMLLEFGCFEIFVEFVNPFLYIGLLVAPANVDHREGCLCWQQRVFSSSSGWQFVNSNRSSHRYNSCTELLKGVEGLLNPITESPGKEALYRVQVIQQVEVPML